MLTVAESMALAVLKGDKAAAYSLADKLLEELHTDPSEVQQRLAELRHKPPVVGYEVWACPEFQAFCRRFGIHWDLLTIEMVITLEADGLVMVQQKYRGADNFTDSVGEVNGSTATLDG
jgi:hypothetical protein